MQVCAVALDHRKENLADDETGNKLARGTHKEKQPIDLCALIDVHQNDGHNDGGGDDGRERGKITGESVFAEVAPDEPDEKGGDERGKTAEDGIPERAEDEIPDEVAERKTRDGGGSEERKDHHRLADAELKRRSLREHGTEVGEDGIDRGNHRGLRDIPCALV